MAKFSESRGMTCRKFVSETGRNHPKLDENTFFRNRNIATEMLNFQGVFYLENKLWLLLLMKSVPKRSQNTQLNQV